MNKKFNKTCKQVIFSLAAAAFLLGQVPQANYLYATTVNTDVSNNTNVIQIKDTKITLGKITDDTKNKRGVINAVVERASGFPDEATKIMLNGEGQITIAGKSNAMHLYLYDFKKVSNTQANVKLSISTMVKTDRGFESKDLTAAQLKGAKMTMTIKQVQYTKDLTALTDEFSTAIKQAKAIQGVTGEQAGVGFINKGGSFINKGNMNIPVFKGSDDVILNNVGFINGRFMMRIEQNNGSFAMIEMRDANKKHIVGTGINISNSHEEIMIYDAVKDSATLSKCKISGNGSVVLATDKESKTLNYTF